jgi:beta-lactam-binding protein with PASTA domain
VAIPQLRGLPVDAAQQALQQLGLTTQVTTQVDGSVPVGTVLSTQPDGGTQVPVGSQVILVVAAAAPTSQAPSTDPSNSASPSPSG